MREKLIELLNGVLTMEDVTSSEEVADHLLANGVTVRGQGKWEQQYEGCGLLRCSACGYEYCDFIECQNFCGNCGCEMRGDD